MIKKANKIIALPNIENSGSCSATLVLEKKARETNNQSKNKGNAYFRSQILERTVPAQGGN